MRALIYTTLCIYLYVHIYYPKKVSIIFYDSIKSEKKSELSKKEDLFHYYAYNLYEEWTVTITSFFFFFFLASFSIVF